MKVQHYYPVTLTIDGEEVGLRIKRMTIEEHSEFSSRLAKTGRPTFLRFVSRAPWGPEQERDQKGEYVTSFDEIAERRIQQMSPETRAEYEVAVGEDEQQAKEFLTWACEQFVTVERGLIEELGDGTERSVTAGLDLLRIFGARRDVLQEVLAAIRQENELDARQKKALRSLTGSSPSSNGHRPARAGRKRGTTVKPAGTGDSPNNGDATAGNEPSGSTGISPSGRVPSTH